MFSATALWRINRGSTPNLLTTDLITRRRRSQLIAAVVIRMAGVSLRPGPDGFVASVLVVKLFPKILVKHWLFLRGSPAVALPVGNPFLDAILHVLRIGNDLNLTGLAQCSQAFARGRKLHPV